MLHWGDWWNYLNSFSSIAQQIIKYSTCKRKVNSLQNHFHQHFFFIFFIANEKNVWRPPSNFPLGSNEKTQGGYQKNFIWSKINNLTTIHYEKSRSWKPHYLATIIQKTIWTKKTTCIQLLCNYPLGITTIVRLSP
jgi:hypothetical protein